MRQNRGRVQINPKSYGKKQTTWRRETKSQNREEIKAAEEKKRKKKKKKDFNVNVSVMWVLKSVLSHLMKKASCPNFIGGAWSRAQLMRQKIWTPHFGKFMTNYNLEKR